MKKLVRLNSGMEAQMLAEALKSQGIHTEIQGSKEYTSIVLGTDQGAYNVLVDPEKFEEASAFWRAQNVKPLSDANSTTHDSNSYIKKAIVFALLAGIMAPIIFNYVSLKNLSFFLKQESSSARKAVVSIIVIALQIPGIFLVYFIYKTWLHN